MLKDFMQIIYKFILIVIVTIKHILADLFKKNNIDKNDESDTSDDSSNTKRKKYTDIYNVDENLDSIYLETKIITSKIKKVENDLVMDKNEKKNEIMVIQKKINNIEKRANAIIPKKNIKKVEIERINKIISKNKEKVNEYAIKNKIDIKPKEAEINNTLTSEVLEHIDNKNEGMINGLNKTVPDEDIKGNKNLVDQAKKVEIIKDNVEDRKKIIPITLPIINKKLDKENKIQTNVELPKIESIDLSKISNKDKKKETYKAYVMESNKVLKEAKEIFKEVDEDIKGNTRFDNNKYKILEVKGKIRKIKDNYYEFKHNRYIYELENDFNLKEIDQFEILINSSNVDNYLKKCNVMLEKLEEYKKHNEVVYKPKEEKKEKREIKKEEKVEEKKEAKEEKKEKKPKLLLEIEEASNIIERDIMRQTVLVSKLEESIEKTPTFERRGKRLGFFDNILSNTLRIGISILPFKLIRNRKLGLLVTGFMINNNIRTMRKSLSPEITCDYVRLSRHVKTEMDIANSYERICNDSMYQVSILKEEFLKYYGYLNNPEIKKLYMKLESLEENISRELDRINESKIYLNDKVKKIGSRYDKRDNFK